jgi:hypothetical protein
MSSATRLFPVLAAGWLVGCVGAVPIVDFYEADAETLRRFGGIEIVHEHDGFEDLGELKGLQCDRIAATRSPHEPAARAVAIDQLRLKAAARGADAIADPHCRISTDLDWANNCFSTVLCISHALRRSDSESAAAD